MKLQENDNEDNFNYSFHILTSLLLLKRSQVSLCPKQQFSSGGLLCHLVKLYQFFNCLPLANTRHQTETETSVLSVINFLWPNLPAESLAAQILNWAEKVPTSNLQRTTYRYVRWQQNLLNKCIARQVSQWFSVSLEWLDLVLGLRPTGSHIFSITYHQPPLPLLSLEFSGGGEVNYFNMIML